MDVNSLIRHINFLNNYDIGGLWVLGTGSEDMHLTMDQRLIVAQTACNANEGKVPLFLGCSFYSFRETTDFIQLTSGMESQAYHWMPYHPLLNWDRILSVYEVLRGQVPLWAYSSANWSKGMPVWVVKELKSIGLKGIKFSSQRTSDLQDVIALQDDFQVITAVAGQFLTCLRMGSLAHTTSLAGVYPEKFIALYDAHRRQKDDVAQRWQERIWDDVKALGTTKKDNFLSAADEKRELVKMGIYETTEVTFPYGEAES